MDGPVPSLDDEQVCQCFKLKQYLAKAQEEITVLQQALGKAQRANCYLKEQHNSQSSHCMCLLWEKACDNFDNCSRDPSTSVNDLDYPSPRDNLASPSINNTEANNVSMYTLDLLRTKKNTNHIIKDNTRRTT